MNCKKNNEGTSLELYRSDAMATLTSWVAGADCAATLADKAAAACQSSLSPSVPPTPAVVALCKQIESSPCSQDATSACLTRLEVMSDATIQALSACIGDPCPLNHLPDLPDLSVKT